jgi:NAD(P)-dependent dehydrogenase (short-subunit alcohol dehydrogenase family)
MDFTNKRIVVTGGAGGIGVETCDAFLQRGASVFLIDIEADRIAAAASRLGHSPRLHTLSSLIDSPESCAAAFAAATQALGGPIHALVNLAGVFEPDALDPSGRPTYDRQIAFNLTNAYDMTVAFLPNRAQDEPTAIVFTSSIAYRRGGIDHPAYSAAKGGIVGLTRSLSRKLAPATRVNAVAPGVILTRMTDQVIARQGNERLAQIPLQRFGKPSEIATVIRFLCSEDASYITGQTITIDGGMTNA